MQVMTRRIRVGGRESCACEGYRVKESRVVLDHRCRMDREFSDLEFLKFISHYIDIIKVTI